MKCAIIVFLTVLAITAVSLHSVEAAVTCGEVDAALIPCVPFLTGRINTPSQGCCAGAKTVKAMAQSTADKREACKCVKAAAIRYTDLKDEAAQSLPSKCGVELDIPISRSVDCDKAFRGGGVWGEEEEEVEGIYYKFMTI